MRSFNPDKKQIRTLLQSEIGSDFVALVEIKAGSNRWPLECHSFLRLPDYEKTPKIKGFGLQNLLNFRCFYFHSTHIPLFPLGWGWNFSRLGGTHKPHGTCKKPVISTCSGPAGHGEWQLLMLPFPVISASAESSQFLWLQRVQKALVSCEYCLDRLCQFSTKSSREKFGINGS